MPAGGTFFGKGVQDLHQYLSHPLDCDQRRDLIHVHTRTQLDRKVVSQTNLEEGNGLLRQLAVLIDGRAFTEHLLNVFKNKVARRLYPEGLFQSVVDVEKVERLCSQISHERVLGLNGLFLTLQSLGN